jgi:hypothetical protein
VFGVQLEQLLRVFELFIEEAIYSLPFLVEGVLRVDQAGGKNRTGGRSCGHRPPLAKLALTRSIRAEIGTGSA